MLSQSSLSLSCLYNCRAGNQLDIHFTAQLKTLFRYVFLSVSTQFIFLYLIDSLYFCHCILFPFIFFTFFLVLSSFLIFCVVFCCIVLCCIVLYCVVLYRIVLYYIVLHCFGLYCMVLYCVVLY